jgi:hypothetical protein
MGLLTGISNVNSGIVGLGAIANTFFPKQIVIKHEPSTLEVQIDSASAINSDTSVNVSQHPAEDGKVFIQNISRNPRTMTLQCTLSNIIRLSNIKTLSAAAQYATALLLPEAGAISNLFLNQEDTISERLNLLRTFMGEGSVVLVLGLPDQSAFNYVITNISDSMTSQTGRKARTVNITLQEAFIVGLSAPNVSEGGLFSKVTSSIASAISEFPQTLADLASRGITL